MEAVTLIVKGLKVLGGFDVVIDGKTHHETTSSFGKKTDHLVLVILLVFKHTLNHPGLQSLAIDRFEILLRGHIDDGGLTLFALQFIQMLRDA